MTPGVEMKGSKSTINMLTTHSYAWSGNEGVKINLFFIMVNSTLTVD